MKRMKAVADEVAIEGTTPVLSCEDAQMTMWLLLVCSRGDQAEVDVPRGWAKRHLKKGRQIKLRNDRRHNDYPMRVTGLSESNEPGRMRVQIRAA